MAIIKNSFKSSGPLYNEFNPDPKLSKIFDAVNISRPVISRIYKKYTSNAYNLIKQDPYRLIDDIYGVAFTIADNVAEQFNVECTSPARIQAGITYILKYSISNQGHTCLPFNDLVSITKDLLEIDLHHIIDQVDIMLKSEILITVNNLIYEKSFYETEKYIGEKLKSLLKVEAGKVDMSSVDTSTLAADQLSAINKVVNSNVFILTGAPGTGKTYTIKYILSLLGGTVKCHKCKGSGKYTYVGDIEPEECPSCSGTGSTSRIKLAAPTGKASKRMTEQTGKPASTIHKLLEPMYNSQTKSFEFMCTETNPIDADVIILDEVSMIDVKLMESFLRAVSPGTRLIMIGDTYQLPPVGAGYVLRDMIASGVIPMEELTIIKRQDEGLIINNCHAIKNGQDIEYKRTDDFGFICVDDIEDIKTNIYNLIKIAVPEMMVGVDVSDTRKNKYSHALERFSTFRDFQVITPLREKTELGCKLLNQYLQQKLNPNPAVKIGKKGNIYQYRVGDKVIQSKNNYEKNILNGDIGYVKSIDPWSKKMIVKFESPNRTVNIPMYGKENNLNLAYAITAHKFQGSENKIIIIPIHKCFGSLIMQRNWLYTAISRASELCILIGDKTQIPLIINRNHQIKRFTNLQEFLKG